MLTKPHVAVLMMLKNEEKRLPVTLKSIENHVDSIIVYDTGSIDGTISILENFCSKRHIPLHLLQGEFIDFASSRNKSLRFADTIPGVDFIILMDCNDELRGGDELRSYLFTQQGKTEPSAWLLNQQWLSGEYTDYYNCRLIRPQRGWYYKGVVHEWLTNDSGENVTVKVPHPTCLFQDRNADDDKTSKRFHRDVKALLKAHKDEPDESRTVFYLAQTYECLGNIEKAYRYFSIRTTLCGFYEEVFEAHLRLSKLAKRLKKPWHVRRTHLMNALERIHRAEPLVELAIHYRECEDFWMSYQYAKMACDLEYPTEILFIDKHVYDYLRFHILGIVAFYVQKYQDGYIACIKAGKDVDISNSTHYLPHLK